MVDFTKVKSYMSQLTPQNGGYSGNPFTGGESSGQGAPYTGKTLGSYNPLSFGGATQSTSGGKAFETFAVPERSNQHASFLPEGAGNTIISTSGDVKGNKLNTFA